MVVVIPRWWSPAVGIQRSSSSCFLESPLQLRKHSLLIRTRLPLIKYSENRLISYFLDLNMASSVSRNFLVTGAARGIGRGLSRLLLKKGHRVLLLDHNKEELEHTVSLISRSHRAGEDFDSLICNLRNPPEIKSAAERANKLFSGHLDCLVNNAACEYRHPHDI